MQCKIHSPLLKKTMKHCFNWHEKCCSHSVRKEDCMFILLQVLNCSCANVVMVINEVAGNHVMTAVLLIGEISQHRILHLISIWFILYMNMVKFNSIELILSVSSRLELDFRFSVMSYSTN